MFWFWFWFWNLFLILFLDLKKEIKPSSLSNHLNSILIPRVSGSEGNRVVQKYIINHFVQLGWTVKQDPFVTETPLGPIHFNNIHVIHPSNPNARSLVLAAHFDSKYFKEFSFLGATDSAVPCAILLELAELIHQHYLNVSLQMVFFDGEEAFVEWNSTDSIYGAKHLAKKWQTTFISNQSLIERIELFVLLDLIGTKDTQFVSFYPNTHSYYQHFLSIQQLQLNSLLKPG